MEIDKGLIFESFVLLVSGIILGICITNLFEISVQDIYNSVTEKNREFDISACDQYEDLSDSAYCLRDYVKTFFNYSVREDTIKSLNDIQLNGGDCFDYSHLYDSMLKELGFKSKVEGIPGHAFTIAWNENETDVLEYCHIDMLNINCYNF